MGNTRRLFSLTIILLALYVIGGFLLPVAMGGVLAVLFYPLLKKLEGSKKLSTRTSAALISVFTLIVVVIPVVVLVAAGAKMGIQQLQIWRATPNSESNGMTVFESFLEIPFIHRIVELLTSRFSIEVREILNALQDLAKGIGLRVADGLGSFLTHLPSYTIGLIIVLLSNFFFLIDGVKIVRFVRLNSFFDPVGTETLIRSFSGICRSVILATLVSGFVQTTLFSLASVIVGRSNVALTGFAIFFASFVPLLGSAPITFGVAIHQLLTVGSASGIVLLVTALLVAVVDNFVRPIVLRGSANLHPLIAFVAVLGGLETMGFIGVFLGPILLALAMATLQVISKTGSPQILDESGSGPKQPISVSPLET